jgi:hypothetical protein
MAVPVDLLDRTLTVYRRRKGQTLRQEVRGFYRYRDIWTEDRFQREFLLVLAEDLPLAPGDRIFDGIGPETVDWETFLPVTVPGLAQVGAVAPYRFRGKFHHIEATH